MSCLSIFNHPHRVLQAPFHAERYSKTQVEDSGKPRFQKRPNSLQMDRVYDSVKSNTLFAALSQEPLPIFPTLLFMLVKPEYLPRPNRVSSSIDFNRMLHTAFMEEDNTTLARTLYRTSDGQTISALDRVNETWSSMFSGFVPEQFDLEFVASIPGSIPHSPVHPAPTLSLDDNAKSMSFSRQQFLEIIPNPESIHAYPKRFGRIGKMHRDVSVTHLKCCCQRFALESSWSRTIGRSIPLFVEGTDNTSEQPEVPRKRAISQRIVREEG